MDHSLYSHSLLISLPLMLFFGFHLILAPVPDKKLFGSYKLSSRLMGTALLVLSANYLVHYFLNVRSKDVEATIMMNLSTYFLCYWLFSSAMMTLLDKNYITRRRFTFHMSLWLTFTALTCCVQLFLSESPAQNWCLAALAAFVVSYGMFLAIRLLRTYYRAIKMFDNTHSDDIGSYIRWLSIFTYWAIGFGVSCGLLTFLPDRYIFLWILSSIPFYIYLYCCYQNYILFYEKVESALMEEADMPPIETGKAEKESPNDTSPAYFADIEIRINAWMASEGYIKPGISLNDLSAQLCTNRTYLSEYINHIFGVTFREWISDLRIEYAKRLMKQQPQMKMQEISEASGFLSLSHFTRTFSAKEGCSPAKWRHEA